MSYVLINIDIVPDMDEKIRVDMMIDALVSAQDRIDDFVWGTGGEIFGTVGTSGTSGTSGE